jgi:hypothetical protein
VSCDHDPYRTARPLCEHELHYLHLGHVLIRHSHRYPLILMWLAR